MHSELRRKLLLFLLLALACVKGGEMGKQTLAAAGGCYFFCRIELPLSHFSQGDPRWADAMLGSTPATLAQEGCAVASAAMVLSGYGITTDPGTLNAQLIQHNGYTPEGWIYWERALELAAGPDERARGWSWYEGPASYALIDRNLLHGNPVIVRLRRLQPGAPMHFVVIVGKSGWRYCCLDPGRSGIAGARWLDEIPAKITGARFYQLR